MTRSMTRWMLAGFMALVALGAVGAPAQADPPPNPFAGSWSGTWAIAALEKGGTFDWTITDAGGITGTVTTTTIGLESSGNIQGHVGSDGKLMFVGYSGWPFQGMAAIDCDGRLVASATCLRNGAPFNKVDDWLVAVLERN